MTLAELKLIKTFVRQTENICLQQMYKVYSEKLSKKTGTIFRSIKSQIFVECRADKVIFTLHITAGGGNAFYAAFQEYGTGIHASRKDLMKKAYKTDMATISFNKRRLNFPAGSGYLILKRTGDKKGSFHSKGIPATHWFSIGAKQAFDIFYNRAATLQGKIAGLPKIESFLYF